MTRPGYANPCRCQLRQTPGGIYLTVGLNSEDSVKKKQLRKVDIEHRAFNLAWKEKYFFISSLDRPTCAATGRQSIEHQTLRQCLPRRGKTPSIDCQATCRKQLHSSASRLLRPTRYCVPVMRFPASLLTG